MRRSIPRGEEQRWSIRRGCRTSAQEDVLVVAGSCPLLVDEREIALRTWDFVHGPPHTAHAFVGTGEEPCVIVMTDPRRPDEHPIAYPRPPPARSHGCETQVETASAHEACAPFSHRRVRRPRVWSRLPWARPPLGEPG